MTYRDCFEAFLGARIAAGGGPAEIERLQSARQGRDSVVRMEEFARWLEEEPFACERCEAAFWAASVTHGEDDEVLCQWCRLTYPALGAEPVSGWVRTWRR